MPEPASAPQPESNPESRSSSSAADSAVAGSGAAALPWTVVAAGILVALEGALGLGAAVVFAVRAALGKIEPATSGYGTAGWFAVLGGAVLAAGLALTRGKRWGRAIAVLTELLLLPVVWSLLTDSAQPVLGALVGVVAVAGLALLFAAPTTRWAAAGYAADTE